MEFSPALVQQLKVVRLAERAGGPSLGSVPVKVRVVGEPWGCTCLYPQDIPVCCWCGGWADEAPHQVLDIA